MACADCFVGLGMWVTHWAGHRHIIPGWFEFHTIGHHVKGYPPARFLTERYASTEGVRKGKRHTVFDMNAAMYLPWPFIIGAAHRALAGTTHAETALCLLVSLALIAENEYMHVQVHTLGSRWEGRGWFEVMRRLHFLHHKEGMHHNYAMADFLFDFLSGNLMNLY